MRSSLSLELNFKISGSNYVIVTDVGLILFIFIILHTYVIHIVSFAF